MWLLGFWCTLINWLASELLGQAIGRMLCAIGFKPWPYPAPAPAPALACLMWRDGTAGSQLLAMCWTKYHRLYLSVTAQAQEMTSSHDGCNGSTWEGHSYIAYITYLRKEFSGQQVPSTRSMKTKIWWYTPPTIIKMTGDWKWQWFSIMFWRYYFLLHAVLCL